EIDEKYANPITFWSDHATKGSGTVICSTHFKDDEDNSGGDGSGKMKQEVRFGKHAAFSTPIKEFKKGAHKDMI
ncbi:hypothetical protein HK100_010206, partial [Physocladia obscura]